MYFESSSGILGKDQILSSAVYDFLTATSDTGELSNDNQAIVVLVLSFCTSLYHLCSRVKRVGLFANHTGKSVTRMSIPLYVFFALMINCTHIYCNCEITSSMTLQSIIRLF